MVPNPRAAPTILNVQVVLHSVVDLTLVHAQTSLGTTAQELTGGWEGYDSRVAGMSVFGPSKIPAPTQELGHTLFAENDIEGFLAISAKIPWSQNLVIFPSKLQAGSSVVFSSPATRDEYRIDTAGERYIQLP